MATGLSDYRIYCHTHRRQCVVDRVDHCRHRADGFTFSAALVSAWVSAGYLDMAEFYGLSLGCLLQQIVGEHGCQRVTIVVGEVFQKRVTDVLHCPTGNLALRDSRVGHRNHVFTDSAAEQYNFFCC